MTDEAPKTANELNLMQKFPPPPEQRVTLANWVEGPPVRWSFMHACELIPSAEAHRGHGPVVELPYRELALNAIQFSANTDILGWILERVTATRFTELFGREIWQYMGARENAAMSVDPWGSAEASGGFNITLRDLGLFGLMMLNKGEHNGRQIIPRAYIHDTLFDGDNTAWLKGNGDGLADFYPKGAYHNQFWISGNDHGAFFCVGIHGQYVYIDPKADMVIVKFSSLPKAIVEFAEENTLLGFDAIAKSLI